MQKTKQNKNINELIMNPALQTDERTEPNS